MSKTDEDESLNEIVDDEEELGYKPPKPKDMHDILELDADDESLRRYKEKLLPPTTIIVKDHDPRKVIPSKISLIFTDHPTETFSLEQDLSVYKNTVVTIKEGSPYRFRLEFYVQRDIVTGLQYHVSLKSYLRSDKMHYMIGSRAPSKDLYVYESSTETAPTGLVARGEYTMKSLITDDDKNEYARWEWLLKISSKWSK